MSAPRAAAMPLWARDLVAEVRCLSGEVARLRCALADLGHIQGDDLDEVLIIAIAEAVQDNVFSCRELFTHAHVIGGDLQDTLAASEIRNAQQLGKRLERLQRGTWPGLTLQRVGNDNKGALWSMVRV